MRWNDTAIALMAAFPLVLGGCDEGRLPTLVVEPGARGLWAIPIDLEALAADPDRVYFLEITQEDETNEIVALDAGTGREEWRVDTRLIFPPHSAFDVFADERGIYSLTSNALAAHGPMGEVRWKIETDFLGHRRALASAGSLFVAGFRQLAALDPANGMSHWSVPFEPAASGASWLAVREPLICMIWQSQTHDPGVHARVSCHETGSGARRWATALPDTTGLPAEVGVRSIVITSDRVIATTSDEILGLDILTGDIVWRSEVLRPLGLGGTEQVVVLCRGAGDVELRCSGFHPLTGEILWARDIGSGIPGAFSERGITTTNGSVLIINEGELVRLDAETGSILARARPDVFPPSHFWGEVVVGGDRVFVGTPFSLHAFRLDRLSN